MGGGGPKIKIGNPIKAVTKAVKDVSDYSVGDKSFIKNAGKELERAYKVNQEGINATAGLAARGAAAYFTGGASEALGGGDLLTKQFGGAKDTAALGELAGLAGGGSTALAGKLFNKTQALPPPPPQNYVMQESGGNNMAWYDDFADIGKDYARQSLGLTNGSSKDRNISQPLQPAVITAPAPAAPDNTNRNLMIAGGALAALVGLAVVFKR